MDCLSKDVLIGFSMSLVLTIGSALLCVTQPVTIANRKEKGGGDSRIKGDTFCKCGYRLSKVIALAFIFCEKTQFWLFLIS